MLMKRFLLIWLLLICLFHDLSSQTIEDCIERVTKDIRNNPNIDLSPKAEKSILESCEYQSNQQGFDGLIFDNYHDFVHSVHSSPLSTYGIYEYIEEIIEWILDESMRNIISFQAKWSYALITNDTNSLNDSKNLSFLTEQISFEDKQFIKYLKSLMNGIDEEELWSLSYDFANKQFEFIDIKKLAEIYESFEGGLQFGIEIFCKPAPSTNNNKNEPFLIWNGRAGGNGGYNKDHHPAFLYDGGGGIEMNNNSVSVGGSTGYRYPDEWIIDHNANGERFYDIEVSKFEEMLKNTKLCHEIIIQSGGGSGARFKKYDQNSTLHGFTYYALNFVVGSNEEKLEVTTLISIILCSFVITTLLFGLLWFCTKSRKHSNIKFRKARINTNEDELENEFDDEFDDEFQESEDDEGQKENIFNCLLWIN